MKNGSNWNCNSPQTRSLSESELEEIRRILRRTGGHRYNDDPPARWPQDPAKIAWPKVKFSRMLIFAMVVSCIALGLFIGHVVERTWSEVNHMIINSER